jgi:MFS family permease
MFMGSLDSSIVVIGLPTILEHIHATISQGIWIITGYTFMMTILPVLLGRLADLYGRVRLYNLGFAIFTVSSLFCALSRTGEQLVTRIHHLIERALISRISFNYKSKENGLGSNI